MNLPKMKNSCFHIFVSFYFFTKLTRFFFPTWFIFLLLFGRVYIYSFSNLSFFFFFLLLSPFVNSADEDMATAKNKKAEEDEDDDSPPAPKWTEGLIKKPDRAHVQKQLRFYGTIMAIGVLLPPMEQLMSFMSFFVCIAQIGYRGMSEEEIAGGGMSYFGNAGGRNPSRTSSMRKSTFLCMFLALFNTIMSNILYPSTLGYKSYSDTLKFFIRTVLWGLEASYFQTYRPM